MCVIQYWSADATRKALKAMAGQASLPAPLCGPSSPNVRAAAREGEGEGSLLLAPKCASLFRTEHGSGSATTSKTSNVCNFGSPGDPGSTSEPPFLTCFA